MLTPVSSNTIAATGNQIDLAATAAITSPIKYATASPDSVVTKGSNTAAAVKSHDK
jgi:hypothetical protein